MSQIAGILSPTVNRCRRDIALIGFMPDFRLLFLDASGAAAHVYEFQAPDVDAALSVAEGKRGLSVMELWTGERKVQRWDCFSPD
jgi:hypothetical protein